MVFPLYCDWTSNKTSEKQFTLKVLKAHAVSPPALSPSFDCSPYTLWFRFPPFSLPRLVDNIRRQCSFLPLVCYSGDLLPRRDVSATCLRLRQWPATPGVGDLLPAVTHLSSFNIQDSLTCTSVHQLSLSVAYGITLDLTRLQNKAYLLTFFGKNDRNPWLYWQQTVISNAPRNNLLSHFGIFSSSCHSWEIKCNSKVPFD